MRNTKHHRRLTSKPLCTLYRASHTPPHTTASWHITPLLSWLPACPDLFIRWFNYIKCGSPVLTCSIHCRSKHNPCHLYRPHCSRLDVLRRTIHMRHAGSSCLLPCVLGDSTTINSSSYHLQNIKCLLLFTECIKIRHCIKAVTYGNLWQISYIWTDKFNVSATFLKI